MAGTAALIVGIICASAYLASQNANSSSDPPSAPAKPGDSNYFGPDETKPIFTRNGEVVCATELGLSKLWEHWRAGVKSDPFTYGCMGWADGYLAKILKTDGVFERWANDLP
jgi:hypothetical protein